VSPTRTVRIHSQVLERLADRIAAALETLHERQPLRSSFPISMLAAGFDYVGQPAVLDSILQQMRADGRIQVSTRGVALAGRGPKLSRNEQQLLAQLAQWFREAGIESPSPKECQQRAAKNQASVPQLIQLLAADGELVEITADYFLHRDVEQEARGRVAAAMAGKQGMTLSEIREVLGTSRKYAVPLAEHWDKSGFTVRQGDLRVLKS
jgi:selenocysteine-specific elongation factor